LKENYVEDSEHTFRFEYPKEFLKWALLVPGYISDWHVGVRVSKTKKLLAFISGTPVKSKIKERNVKLAQINYLCVSKKLREKRLAPVLIKEVTRRVNLKDVWQAIFTAGVVIPRPISTATYLHRSLNAKKLIEVGFSALPMGESMANHLKRLKLPTEDEVTLKENSYFREMQKKDIAQVYKLVKEHLKKFKLFPVYTQEDVAHVLLPRDKVVYTYVVENTETKEITDIVSFYRLPTQILQKQGHLHETIEVTLKP
jgi:glycylpeptide N-tetradecanoyltransferase